MQTGRHQHSIRCRRHRRSSHRVVAMCWTIAHRCHGGWCVDVDCAEQGERRARESTARWRQVTSARRDHVVVGSVWACGSPDSRHDGDGVGAIRSCRSPAASRSARGVRRADVDRRIARGAEVLVVGDDGFVPDHRTGDGLSCYRSVAESTMRSRSHDRAYSGGYYRVVEPNDATRERTRQLRGRTAAARSSARLLD